MICHLIIPPLRLILGKASSRRELASLRCYSLFTEPPEVLRLMRPGDRTVRYERGWDPAKLPFTLIYYYDLRVFIIAFRA